MGTAIVIVILLAVIILAVKGSIGHIKGEGGCCGGGGSVKEESVKLEKPVVATKVLYIEGMHCENCSNRVTRELQKADGVSCKVKLKKNLAVVTMDHMVEDEELKAVVEKAGYHVTSIESK